MKWDVFSTDTTHQKLNQDQIGNINRLITLSEIEAFTKSSPTKINQELDAFITEFHQL